MTKRAELRLDRLNVAGYILKPVYIYCLCRRDGNPE